MTRTILSIFLLSTLFGFYSPPENSKKPPTVETPERILKNAIQAIGGRRVLERIESFQLHGIMRLSDGRPVVEVELATSKGGKVLGVLSFVTLGQSRFGSDGETSWEQNFDSKKTITWSIIDQDTLSQKVQQINWLEWFTTLPNSISTMKVEGKVTFDDEECWQISINNKDKRKQLVFFSCKTHRPRGRRTVESTPNGDTTVEVYFRDWKRVEDLLLFHSINYNRDGNEVSLKLDRIAIDSAPDYLFELPEQIKTLKDLP
ncbi:MAG: hypothetical protein QF718_03985 [Phycisphaerales bacterium]|nr:hypothetical protein [Phycisphaerales bacterium]